MKKIILIGSEGILGSYYKKVLSQNPEVFLVAGDKSFKEKKYKDVIQEIVDLEDPSSIHKFFKKLKQKYGNFDVLINNAAFTTEGTNKSKKNLSKKFEDFELKLWKKTIDINLTGVFLCCKYFIKYFHKKKIDQKIINIGSIYGSSSPHHDIYEKQDFFSNAAYTSSKSGLIGLTKWLSTKYINEKTNINMISPSGVFNNHNKKFVKDYLKITPINRMANPKDIFGIIDFLISDKSSYITGQNYHVDGGFSSW